MELEDVVVGTGMTVFVNVTTNVVRRTIILGAVIFVPPLLTAESLTDSRTLQESLGRASLQPHEVTALLSEDPGAADAAGVDSAVLLSAPSLCLRARCHDYQRPCVRRKVSETSSARLTHD